MENQQTPRQIRKEVALVERNKHIKGKLEFIRILCATLLEKAIEESLGLYDIFELTENSLEGNLLASVWYSILLCIGCTKQQLSGIKNCIVHHYDTSKNVEFDLMLAMTEIAIKIDEEDFQIYTSHPEFPDASSKVEFLQALHTNGHLKKEKVLLFRSQLQKADCPELHTPLTNFCDKHGIEASKIAVPNKKYKRCCKKFNKIKVPVSIFIVAIILILLAGGAIALYCIYKNNYVPRPEKVTVPVGSIASLFYNKFFVDKVDLVCENCDANNAVSVYVVPEGELSYNPVVIPRTLLKQETAPNNQRFEISYNKTTLLCNPNGKAKFEFDIQWNGNTQETCPAQLYLFDSKSSIATFVRNNDKQYPGNVSYAADTTGCLEPGKKTVSFKLLPNTMYHIGWYVSQSVEYSIWLSANLTRYDISGLRENCTIASSKPITCSITHTRYPAKKGNVSLLFSTTSTSPKTVNATSVLVEWNLPQLIGVTFFPGIGVLVIIVALFVCVGFRCQKRRITINTATGEYGALQNR
ncbi:PREDICTED: uncharacterized protein LOC109586992 [Amphimedon queenslandica]|uniref:Uncharacterized protein n=1 Tax=Amphimedon queenslandica TaxID=400682 RepID=A0A1X7TM89_AMPQE|nr:PREDICTED: uncharacterized protein LOC109586992 [Amphimedon queenslandica]|eukprot:XP_019858775.1 PREDICTED: uncharacterized protein LOC109586992 [Amphimedon queenslandica]